MINFKKLLVVSILFSLSAKAGSSLGRTNTVFVLGSLHGEMLNHFGYSLREFIGAMESFKPDLILTEVRSDHPGPVQGSIDGGIEQSIVYAFGAEKNVPVIATDWFTDAFLAKAQKEDETIDPNLKRQITPLDAKYKRAFEHDSFFVLNGKGIQNLIRSKYDLERKFGLTTDRTRNEHICKNIRNALMAVNGKRVLAVFGLDHKYYLEDCFKRHGDKVITAIEFTNETRLRASKISDRLKAQTLKNISESKALLKKRLAEGVYKGGFKDRLKNKLKTYAAWISAVQAL